MNTKMKKYYIYHIDGIKIGCSDNPKMRVKKQGYTEYTILETYDDIIIASNRELELQSQWGYKVDTEPYYKTIKMGSKKSRSKGGAKTAAIPGHMAAIAKIAGISNVKSGHIQQLGKIYGAKTALLGIGVHNFEIRSKAGKIGGKIQGAKNVASGHMDIMREISIKARQIIIEQKDLYGNLIAEYKSGKEAATLLKLHASNINAVCRGKLKHTGGYTFNYK
jgi:hypothetical protein